MLNGRVVAQFECDIQYIGDSEQFCPLTLEIWVFIVNSYFELLLSEVFGKVGYALNRHERNELAPLSLQALIQIKIRTGRNEKSDGSKCSYAGLSL